MERTHYPTIVLGCGGIGSAALYWLARRTGGDVLGIEQHALVHPFGASQDYSRIIRLAYHNVTYARLAAAAYDAWATVAEESGVNPVRITGGVVIGLKGTPGEATVEDYAATMHALAIEYDRFDGDELRYRFPQFQPEGDVTVLFQGRTGIANPNRGNACHSALARLYGATILERAPVLRIEPRDGEVGVVTEAGTFTCARLIVAAGAWTRSLLGTVGIDLPLAVTQEQVTYYATPHLKEFTIGRFPIFQWKEQESIYGFPVYGEIATKAAIDGSGPEVTAETRTFEADPVREERLAGFLRQRIPHFVGPRLYTKTCLYTLPPDRDFILDSLPEHNNIFVVVGAGHAYKFASLLGRILSELALDGRTDADIGAFSLRRTALSEGTSQRNYRI